MNEFIQIYRRNYVTCVKGNVLNSGTAVIIGIFLNLTFFQTVSRFVDWHLHNRYFYSSSWITLKLVPWSSLRNWWRRWNAKRNIACGSASRPPTRTDETLNSSYTYTFQNCIIASQQFRICFANHSTAVSIWRSGWLPTIWSMKFKLTSGLNFKIFVNQEKRQIMSINYVTALVEDYLRKGVSGSRARRSLCNYRVR